VRFRLGPGPVFVYEWLTTARRWQLYGLRALFVGAMLIGMMIVWQRTTRDNRPDQTVSIQQMANYGQSLYFTIVTIELSLVLLAAPAATAGAVCLDKARGTLDHMLTTDLSNAEIVLGKLGVRLVPVLGLIACVLPITALSGLLGGIDPLALGGSFLLAIGCAVLGCSLAMTLSVWGRKTHEVLMLTYLLLIVWIGSPAWVAIAMFSLRSSPPPLAAPLLWDCAIFSNPYYLAYAPYLEPGKVGWMAYLGLLAGCLGVSGLLAGLATMRIRGVAMRQAGQSGATRRRSRFAIRFPRLPGLPRLPGPSLDDNPVLWREWHRSRPTGFMRLAWLLYSGFGVLWILLALRVMADGRGSEGAIAGMNVFQVSVGLLLLSVGAATSLAEERMRGSLDVLLTTPMSTRSILEGKWWGTFRQVRLLAIWPAVTAGFLLATSGRIFAYVALLGLIAAYGAAITSLGLALATWVSRLGRAVALCVAGYVVFSIGWLILIFVLFLGDRPDENFILPAVMGSPLYGTAFATMVVAPDSHIGPAGPQAVWLGTLFWIVVHGVAAAGLFAITVATFDRCLGRASETSGLPSFDAEKELVAGLEPDY
jgi:ABC-type transport system involved in multi-copper enzyme maturation permease subunit